jgi:hypothetical protein
VSLLILLDFWGVTLYLGIWGVTLYLGIFRRLEGSNVFIFSVSQSTDLTDC